MSVLNSTVLERCYINGSWDFQQRIPNPSIAGYDATVRALFDPLNGDLYNEFSRLLNGLNASYVDIRRFENPLAIFKKPSENWNFGTSERHLAVHYLQARSPRFDSETLLKVERPEFEEWFYSLNYETRYEFSWSRYEMKQAFANDGYGYDDLLQATITQMMSSAAYDEMNTMLNTFAEANSRMGGLYRYHVSAAPTDETTAKELLKGIRTVAGRMKFPSLLYNHIPVPVHTDGSRLCLFILPEVRASLDVDALASIFQLSYADPKEIAYRIIDVPYFPIPNVYAILADEDFIFWRDYMTGMEPPFYNPENRTTKYYYFESAAVGFNPAAPVVCFTTDAATTIPTVTMSITGATLTAASAAYPGGEVETTFALTGTVSPANTKIQVEPNSAVYTVTAIDDNDAPIALNSRTYVDEYGVLHIQKTGISAGDTIIVSAEGTYINPSGVTSTYTATLDLELTATPAVGAKEGPVNVKPYIEYTDTTEPTTASE